ESIAAMRMRWYRWFALPYTVIRFVLGFAFELLGKIIATLVGLLATLFVVVGRFLGSVFYYLTYPILRGFDGILLALTWVYRRILRWSLSYAVVVLLGVFVGTGLLVRALDDVDTELVP